VGVVLQAATTNVTADARSNDMQQRVETVSRGIVKEYGMTCAAANHNCAPTPSPVQEE
jgi:hypothetical protein